MNQLIKTPNALDLRESRLEQSCSCLTVDIHTRDYSRREQNYCPKRLRDRGQLWQQDTFLVLRLRSSSSPVREASRAFVFKLDLSIEITVGDD